MREQSSDMNSQRLVVEGAGEVVAEVVEEIKTPSPQAVHEDQNSWAR